MRNSLIVALLMLIWAGMGVCLAQAQTITGTITDPSGAVVAEATVRLISNGNVIAERHTDQRGAFTVYLDGRCAACQLSVVAAGFADVTIPVEFNNQERVQVAVRLRIATASESVRVEVKSAPFADQLDVGSVRESSAKDLGEALAQVDAVSKIRKAGIANDIVLRGFQQGNINVTIDGARIFAACPGHMDPAVQHVDFAEVERVDIVKGAFDMTRSGSLGATLNVVTKSPPLGVRVTPSMSVGSWSFVNPSLTASFGNQAFRALGGYSYRSSDPYQDGRGRSFLTYANYNAAASPQKSFELNTGWLRTEFSPGVHHNVQIGYTRQQAGLVLYPYLTMDSGSDNADRLSVRHEVRDLGGTVHAVRTQAYFTQVQHFMSDRLRSSARPGGWSMASDASTRAIGGSAVIDIARGITVGADGYYRNWTVLGYMNMMGTVGPANPTVPDVDTRVVGTFADYERSITDRLRFSGGVRFDYASMSAGPVNTSNYFNYHATRKTGTTDAYPSGNIRISYALPGGVEIFGGLGTTGRIPDAEERYINRSSKNAITVGDPDLPIVRNTDITAGLVIRHGVSYVKPTVFYSTVSDYILVNNQPRAITTAAPARARSYTNVDARIYGAEMDYAFGLPAGLSLNGGFAYTRGRNDRKPESGVNDTDLPEMPAPKVWTALRFSWKYVFGELGGTGVGRQSRVDTDLNETPTAGYGLMNVKFGITYRKWSVRVMVDNLLNRYYYEHLSYYRDPYASGAKIPEPGRNLFTQIQFVF